MSRLLLGTICGLVYGALSAASMIPLSFSDKTAALTGAFLNRFAIGFVIGAARLPLPPWAQGLIFGILLSLPDAIITKTYAPILILGAVGGVIIGFVVDKWELDSFPNCDAGYSRLWRSRHRISLFAPGSPAVSRKLESSCYLHDLQSLIPLQNHQAQSKVQSVQVS